MNREGEYFPEWARLERGGDLAWIGENVHIFLPAAKEAFALFGRGAIVVDTTLRPTGEGHPFGYFPQEVVEEGNDEDIKRLVQEYDSTNEIVVVLLKSEERTSAYRVQLLNHNSSQPIIDKNDPLPDIVKN